LADYSEAPDAASKVVAEIVSEELRHSTDRNVTLLAVTAATTLCAEAGLFDSALGEPPKEKTSRPPPMPPGLRLVPIAEALLPAREGPGVADALMLQRPWPERPKAAQHRYGALLSSDRLSLIEQRPSPRRALDEPDAARAADSILALAGFLTRNLDTQSGHVLVEVWVDDAPSDDHGGFGACPSPFAHLLGVHPLRDADLPPGILDDNKPASSSSSESGGSLLVVRYFDEAS